MKNILYIIFMEEEHDQREIIKAKDFVEGGVYEVYDKDNHSHGIYFYPTSYPERMEYENNTKLSEPLKLLILYSRIYHSGIGKYMNFDKRKIYGKKPVSIIRRSESSYDKIKLSGLDLSYAKLMDSHLVRINLSNTILSHADLTGANLTGAILTGADLTGAILTGSILTGSILTSAILTDTDLTGAILTGANLTDANLTGADLTGADLTGANILNGADLTGAILTGAELTKSLFYDSVILTGIKTGGIKGIPGKLPKGYFLVDGYIIGPYIDIPNNNNTIKLKKYKKIKIKNKNNKTKEYIIGPNIDLTSVDLTGLDLTGSILTGSILTSAILTDTDLTDVDLTGAKLTGIKSGGIKGNPRLPSRYVLRNGYIIGPNADLTGADLTGAILTGANLTDANLTGAILTGADLTGANILNGADLTGAILTGADLTKSLFYDSVILTGIKTGGIKGIPRKLPKGYFLVNGYIIGPNVDLTGSDLTDADLTDINLTHADLTGAKLTGAKLTGIKSGGIKGNPRLPSRYVLRNGYIIGPNVDLTRVDLTGLDLTDADLTRVNLTDADLTRVNLTDADLSYANLTHAILTEVNFTRVVNLTRVNFTDANLTGADLTGVNLISANLTDANLTNTNLTNARIYRESLSNVQINQIIGLPNYLVLRQNFRENQENIYINKNLSNGNRISLNNKKKLNNSNTTTPPEISYTRLFDFLLQKKNQVEISKRFVIIGEPGIDAGGPTRTVFQKCYEVFRERYFEWDKDIVNYFILKDLNPELFKEFEKACHFMILLAKKAQVKILLPIHNLLLRLLLSDKPPDTFFENKNSFLENENSIFVKKNNGTYSELNRFKLNAFIEDPLAYIVLENNEVKRLGKNNGNVKPAAASVGAQVVASTLGPNNNNGNNGNNRGNNNNNGNNIGNNNNNGNNTLSGGKRLNNYNKSNQSKLMLGMFLHSQHFSTMKHFIQMKDFITKNWKPNPTIFTNKIDYSYEAFIKRLKFKLPGQNFITFKEFEREEYEMYNTYPLIQLILEYLKHSDKYRMTFTTFTCGSYTYDGIIKIFINYTKIHNLNPPSSTPPFIAHTCFHYIDVNIDLRPNCKCPDVFISTLTDDDRNNNFSIQRIYKGKYMNNKEENNKEENNRDKCGYSLSKLNKVFEKREFNLA